MRIVKCEKIYLSDNEADVWLAFEKILGGLKRGSENPTTKNLVCEIEVLMYELWKKLEEVE